MIVIELLVALVFTLLIMSLLTSSILEVLALIFGFRNKKLLKALELILGKGPLYQEFIQHPGFTQLGIAESGWHKTPTYLSGEQFTALLNRFIPFTQLKSQGTQEYPVQIPEELAENLSMYWEDAGQNEEVFRGKLKHWYQAMMERHSEAYKNFSKKMLFVIGLILTISCNIEVIELGKVLVHQAEVRQIFELAAEQLAVDHAEQSPTPNDIEAALKMVVQYGSAPLSSIPWGWNNNPFASWEASQWIWKGLGWLITACAIAMGAPFWYDLLRKILAIKN
ncbi:MAG: hypothetical protein ACO388_03780 [Saprospiraceae bacterium]|jgi:hypothetical protein